MHVFALLWRLGLARCSARLPRDVAFVSFVLCHARLVSQTEHGSLVLGTCTVEQAYGGMRRSLLRNTHSPTRACVVASESMWCSPYYNGIELGDLPQQQVLVPMCASCACCVLSVKSMVYETSVLDAEEGIRFRNYTIPECQVPHSFSGRHS